MKHFIDDFAGSISDFLKGIFKSICYFLAGMLIVGIPLYGIVLFIRIFY
ncbi:hypothetical protein [Metabacillus indicus]|nr:hypothetical protein [Metabacillus indicus]